MSVTPQDRVKARRVLVVDDEIDLAKAIGLRLAHHGYRVEFAHDGATAMMRTVQTKPDLIVLDIRMPAGDGLTICRRLKGKPDTWDIPIIILTAHVNDQVKREARLSGVKFILQKPYSPKQLMACIEEALAGVV